MKAPIRYIRLRFEELAPIPRRAFSGFGRQRKLSGVASVLHDSASGFPDLEVAGPVLVAGVESKQDREPADSTFLFPLPWHVLIIPLE